MKQINSLILLILMSLLSACGSGGMGSDTSGVLTMTSPAFANFSTTSGKGSTVSYTVSYTPPAGKVPNGVVIHEIISGIGCDTAGTTHSYDFQLYSNTSFNTSFQATRGMTCTISLSIGTMTAGTTVFVP